MVSDSSALARHINDVALIDQHVHGCWLTAGDRQRFENGLNEANTEPLAEFDSGFDSQLGFAVRAHCGPVLGLPKHVAPQAYWERRSQYSETELAGLFLRAAGVGDWLVDTGIVDDVAGVAELEALSGNRVHEVVRLEQVAEQPAQARGHRGRHQIHSGLPRRVRRRSDRAVGRAGCRGRHPVARSGRFPAARPRSAAIRIA